METNLEVKPNDSARLVLRGRLDEQTVPSCWNVLAKGLDKKNVKTLEINVSELRVCDGAGLALLRYLNMGRMTPQAVVSLIGLDAELEKVFYAFTSEDYEALRPKPRGQPRPLLVRSGDAVRRIAANFLEQLAYVGSVLTSLSHSILHPKRSRWLDTLHVFELAGANALPIVSLMSLLLGFIIAFESAQRLAEFGAQLYVANTIMVVMVRDMGPLLTAILLAGRSGSAFAAEIGTMKVNEELNALQTFGLDPISFLVIPRIVAGVILAPLLTFYSILMGVVGGVMVMLGLGFHVWLILHQLAASIRLNDLGAGTSKAVIFGAIISAVGCWYGLQTKQGPSAVGLSTTHAVVTSLLLIIVADACFSAISFVIK